MCSPLEVVERSDGKSLWAQLQPHAQEVKALGAKLERQVDEEVVGQLDLRVVRHSGEVELEHIG